MSFLPPPFAPPYEVDPLYSKSVAYLSMEFAIDQSFKIYSGGLGFLAGSHMRSAADLKQNLVGVGICWSYGYYDQGRGENREMAVQFRRKHYAFLQDTGLVFPVDVHGARVMVKALYLPPGIFDTVPMFFLTSDIDANDGLSRAISHRLYDADNNRRIAQYILLGGGAYRLMQELGCQPDIYHLNEAHGLSAAFKYHQWQRDREALRQHFVFTTHTPEEAGNEKTAFNLLENFHFFGGLAGWEAREITGISGETFNHSLAALRVSKVANGVSKLHGEVAREMWKGHEGLCEITHITNAQNKKYWADGKLESARLAEDVEAFQQRKQRLKERLVREVANQTGKILDPGVLTLVWARRFAAYKRADLITRDLEAFQALLEDTHQPIQILWAGKPYPFDYGAIDLFNQLIARCRELPRAAVLVGYELELSKTLKDGADVWLNNPVIPREASGTSGMSAAMNGAVNFSTYDGWVREFTGPDGLNAEGRRNAFIVPQQEGGDESLDAHDGRQIHRLLREEILPLYYQKPEAWREVVWQSMADVAPAFDADRMAAEYYQKLYTRPS